MPLWLPDLGRPPGELPSCPCHPLLPVRCTPGVSSCGKKNDGAGPATAALRGCEEVLPDLCREPRAAKEGLSKGQEARGVAWSSLIGEATATGERIESYNVGQ